jgi:diaminopimelate decarboxylase
MRTYIAVDGGMSDNARPITYQALYRAVAVDRMTQPCTETVTVAGKHCESGDILIQQAQFPPVQPGEAIAILATGAYNYSMASNYNRITRPAAVLVRDGQGQVIIERETYQDLVKCDRLPDRLKTIS